MEAKVGSIDQVMDFQYLGTDASSHRKSYEEARRQAVIGARISGYISDVTWKNKYLRLERKVKIDKMLLTYGGETWVGTFRTKRLLRALARSEL